VISFILQSLIYRHYILFFNHPAVINYDCIGIGLNNKRCITAIKLRIRRKTKFPQKVNRAVSFNAIKNQLFKLLSLKPNSFICIKKLEDLFLMTPTIVREHRHLPRVKHRSRTSLAFTKKALKYCF